MSQRASMSSTWSTSKVTKPRSHIGVCEWDKFQFIRFSNGARYDWYDQLDHIGPAGNLAPDQDRKPIAESSQFQLGV